MRIKCLFVKYLLYAQKYACGPIAQPMPAAVKTPFVNLIFFKGQRQITVGNKSSNSASIENLADLSNVGSFIC